MELTKDDIKSYLLTLPQDEQNSLIAELKDLSQTFASTKCKLSRREALSLTYCFMSALVVWYG